MGPPRGTARAGGPDRSGRAVRADGGRPRLTVVAPVSVGAPAAAGPDEPDDELDAAGAADTARHGLTIGSSAVVIAASGSTLATLLDEAGAALAECTAGVDAGAPAAIWERFDVGGDDPENLGRDFIDELVDRADRHRHEIVSVLVDRVDGVSGSAAWHAVGRVGLRPFGPRPDPTRHIVGHPRAGRVHVDGSARHWALRATLPLRD